MSGDRRGVVGAVVRRLLLVLAVLLPSALWGVATASAQASLGPHVAQWEVTLDHEVTVDFGPLGTLVVPSPLPATLGTRIVVQEIPREITTFGGATTLEALSTDLQEYVQFFGAPEATIEVAVRALAWDAARRTLVAAGLLWATIWVTRRLLGADRREELSAELHGRRHVLVGSGLVVSLVVATMVSADPARTVDTQGRAASAVFDGTPLEGARLTGRLAGLLDTYGGQVVEAYRSNEDFYDTAAAGLRAQWEARVESEAAVAAFRQAVLDQASGGAGQVGAQEGEADGDDDDGGAGADQEDPQPQEPLTVLVVSDLHCNVGMARVIGTAAELSGATVLLNAGDTTVNGTAVEAYCVRAFAQALPDGVRTVVAGGNHDSDLTATQFRDTGAVVLTGEVVDVEGLRVLGDVDPRETRVGSGTSSVGEETVTGLSRRLADVACADPDGVDLLLIHDPKAGQAVREGCASAQVSGHYHRRIGPLSVGQGVQYVSSSTAGALHGQPTVGPLRGTAEMTVMRFSRETGTWLDYRLLQVRPDGSVNVGFAVRWPGRPVEPRPVGAPR